LKTADEYNFVSGSFEPAPELTVRRDEAAFVRLPSGKVLLAGGFNEAEESLKSAEQFNPETNKFEALAHEMTAERDGPAFALMHDGRVLIATGVADGIKYLDSAEIYDPATGAFESIPAKTLVKRYAPATETLPNGKVLIAGGFTSGGTPEYPRTAELFNPETGTFEMLEGAVHELTETRDEMGHVALADGRVLLLGGYNGSYLGTVESFSPESLIFERLGDELSTKRDAPAAVLLADGRVFIAGGSDGITDLKTAEERLVAPPAVSTVPASGIATNTARLAGTVVGETASSAYFQYGTSSAYGAVTERQRTPASLQPVAVAASLSGLAPGTTYHFRLLAENAGGTNYGVDQTFITHASLTNGAAARPPKLSGVSQSRRRWREGNALAHLASRAPIGTAFSFSLDQAATVTFAFTQQLPGRKVHGRCLKKSRNNAHAKPCVRRVAAGAFSRAGHAGRDVVRFQGRLSHSKRLPLGTFTATITAMTAAGQRSAPVRLSFTIVH